MPLTPPPRPFTPQFVEYLEDYPFRFYVILRSPHANGHARTDTHDTHGAHWNTLEHTGTHWNTLEHDSLRDIQAMPEIVADALRQWFELIRSDVD